PAEPETERVPDGPARPPVDGTSPHPAGGALQPAGSTPPPSAAVPPQPVGSPPGTPAPPPVPHPAGDDAKLIAEALAEIKRVIVGQEHMVERLMVTLLAKGHCLLEGVPGVAKTLAVRTFADVVGGDFARVQFTPDLVPSDIVGTRIYRPSKE